MKRLVDDASYLNNDVKDRFKNLNSEFFVDLYNVLHIDVNNCHIVSIYDTENRFLVDRTTNFSTTSSRSDNDVINTLDDEIEDIFPIPMHIDGRHGRTPLKSRFFFSTYGAYSHFL